MQEQIPREETLFEPLKQLQREMIDDEIVDTYIKIISASYDKAVTYMNVIIIAGYAGFFALWSLSKQYLTSTQARWAALSMLVSICTVVFFEVYKMETTTELLLKQAEILKGPAVKMDSTKALSALRKFEHAYERKNISFVRAWKVNVVVAVLTALVGAGILAFSFIHGLFIAP
jgi:hypothetical protein